MKLHMTAWAQNRTRDSFLLLLSSSDVISLSVGLPLFPDSVEALVSTCLTDCSSRLERLHVVGDRHGSDPGGLNLGWHHNALQLAGLVHVLLCGVSLPGLGSLDWEEDKLGLVFLQALNVQLQSLNTPVAAPHINADANGLGLLL